MLIVWAGIIWLLENLPTWAIVLFVIWNVFMQFRWCWFEMGFRPQDPYQFQLTSASHGAAFILMSPLVANSAMRLGLPRELIPWIWPAAFVAMAYGAYLLALGISRTRTHKKDAQLISRAVLKSCAGVVLLFLHGKHLLPLDQIYWLIRPRVAQIIFYVGAWLVITGITKIVLLVRPWQIDKKRPSNQKPFGNAGFAGTMRGDNVINLRPFGNADFAGSAINENRPVGPIGRWFAGWHWK